MASSISVMAALNLPCWIRASIYKKAIFLLFGCSPYASRKSSSASSWVPVDDTAE
jgi:hypothetical protein